MAFSRQPQCALQSGIRGRLRPASFFNVPSSRLTAEAKTRIIEHASLRYPKPPPPIVIIPPSSPTMFLKSRIPCRRLIRKRKRLRAAPKRFFGARTGSKFPPPPTGKCPQIDDQNEMNSLIKEQRALRQPLERRRPAPNVV